MASQASNEVKLPRAVLRVSESVKARIAERDAATRPPEAPPVETPPQAPTAETPPPTEQVPPAPPVDPRENDAVHWKQRFQTAEGITRQQVRDHKTAVTALNQQITELQEQVRTLQAAVPLPPTDLTKAFSPEEIEKYGEAQCRAMLTTAEAAADNRLQRLLETEIKPLKDAAKRREEDAAKQQADEEKAGFDKFKADLAAIVPNWGAIDVLPGWIAWLQDLDEGTGLPRGEILNAHVHKGNATAAARMFKTYEKVSAPPAPPVAPLGGAADGGGVPPPAAPAVAGGAPSDAEVQKWFKDRALGKPVTREDRAAFEARMKLRNPQAA